MCLMVLKARPQHAENTYYLVKDRKDRTKITRAPCRRRHSRSHEGCESRHNHRYAVVVHDLATQWIQPYCVKQKRLRKLIIAYESSWSRQENQKSFALTDNSLDFVKSCEDLSWKSLYVNTTQIGNQWIAERAVRRIQEGTSAVLLQSGLDEKWWADSMECHCYLRNI